MLGSTVTLAAKPEEAEQLSLAAQLGDLRLLLRSPLDTEKPNYKAVTHHGHPAAGSDAGDGKTDSTDVASSGNVTATLPTLPKVVKTPAPVKEPEKVVEAAAAGDAHAAHRVGRHREQDGVRVGRQGQLLGRRHARQEVGRPEDGR